MSIERKDIRAKLDPAVHAALKLLCRVDGITEAQFIEAVLVPVIKQRIHDATLIAAEATVMGITGNAREFSGAAGNASAIDLAARRKTGR